MLGPASNKIRKIIESANNLKELRQVINYIFDNYKNEFHYTREEIISSINDAFQSGSLSAVTRANGLREQVDTLIKNKAKTKLEIIKLIKEADTQEELIAAIKKATHSYDASFSEKTLTELLEDINQAFLTDSVTRLPEKFGLQAQAQILIAKLKKERAAEIEKGPRTILAEERFDGSYIPLFNSKYKLISGITDFVKMNDTMIFGGYASKQEAIIIDPHSKILNAHYEIIKACIKKSGDLTTRELITLVMNYCKILLPKTKPKISKLDHDNIFVGKLEAQSKVQLLNIESFIDKGGVCRHHSILAAYFLGRLVRDNILAPSEVHIYRNKTLNGAHAVVMMVEDDKVWYIDSLNKEIPIKIPNKGKMKRSDQELYDAVSEASGEKYIKNAKLRFAKLNG